MTLTPELVALIVALVEAGIKEAPVILDAIERALAGTDPMAAIEAETVKGIVPELLLPIKIAAAKATASVPT